MEQIFKQERIDIRFHRIDLSNLHESLNLSYKEFFLLKYSFWDKLCEFNINPRTKLNIMKILEECREFIVSGYELPE